MKTDMKTVDAIIALNRNLTRGVFGTIPAGVLGIASLGVGMVLLYLL